MADGEKDQDPGRQDPPEGGQDGDPGEDEEDPEGGKDQDPPEDGEKDQKDSRKKDQDPEVKRALARRDRALQRAQKAEEEARRLREKYEGQKEDPEVKANRKLVAAEARVVMAAAGLTEVEDQRTLADFLGLEDVTVDPDGTVDSDAIQERLEKLVRIVGKLAKKDQKRVPRTDPRDRGGEKATPKDSQSARRRSMLGYR